MAPIAKPCEVLDSVRLYDIPMYPQLCNEVNGVLEWAYFCGKFGMAENRVFCRVLGYPSFISNGRKSSSTFFSLTKIKNLDCNGNETRLTDCSFSETTQGCMVAEGVECDRCNSSSECLGGHCLMNGTCACRETCLNGGYCFVGNCICPTGLGGDYCEECSPPCQNGGTCFLNGTCECDEMYYGSRCELSNTTQTSESLNSTTISDINESTNNTNIPTSILPEEFSSTLILVIIAVVVPTTVCSCTFIIICLATLIFFGVMISKIKQFGIEKRENRSIPLNGIPISDFSNQASTKRPHEYELDDLNDPNHDYYYIENTQPTQSSSVPRVTIRSQDGNYEIMDYQDMGSYGEKDPESIANSSSNLVAIEQSSKYVVNNLNDY